MIKSEHQIVLGLIVPMASGCNLPTKTLKKGSQNILSERNKNITKFYEHFLTSIYCLKGLLSPKSTYQSFYMKLRGQTLLTTNNMNPSVLRIYCHVWTVIRNFAYTVKTLNIGTPRPATVVVLNIKQFNFTLK